MNLVNRIPTEISFKINLEKRNVSYVSHSASKEFPDALVISGGGGKSIAGLGAIHVLKKNGNLKNLKLVAGTSAGSIVAASVALDRSPVEMVKNFVEDSYIPDFDLINFSKNFGIDTGIHLTRWIDIVVGNDDTTFESIKKKTGIELVVCATNLSTRSPVYFSVRDTPTMNVKKAIRMSCSIPVYFAAITHEDDLYVDGALTDAFPIDHISHMKDVHHPLGIRYKSDEHESHTKVDSLDKFLQSLVITATKDKYNPKSNVLTIDVGNASVFDFRNPEMLKKIFKSGLLQTRDWLKKNK